MKLEKRKRLWKALGRMSMTGNTLEGTEMEKICWKSTGADDNGTEMTLQEAGRKKGKLAEGPGTNGMLEGAERSGKHHK